MGTLSRRRLRQATAHGLQATAAGRANEHWHQALLARMRDIVLVADIDGTLTYRSPAVETALGYRPAEALIDLSLRDSLTGLPNRIALMDRLTVALTHTTRASEVLALLFCDLDEFKRVNWQGFFLARPMGAEAHSSLLAGAAVS